jgi:hypothetical protein
MAKFLNLCSPALLYLVLSVSTLLIILLQNLSTPENAYCVGSVQCTTNYKVTAFVLKVLYTAFWTFVLNSICFSGYEWVSWLLVLIPFLLMFLLIALLMLYGGQTISSYSFSAVTVEESQKAAVNRPI